MSESTRGCRSAIVEKIPLQRFLLNPGPRLMKHLWEFLEDVFEA